MKMFVNHFTALVCILMILLVSSSSTPSSSIHELLRSMGLPAGLVPKQVKSYTVDQNGRLEVQLDGPCMAVYENRALFQSVFSANLSYGSLIGVQGLSQEELFVWLPVKDILVNYPTSGVILFDIGLAHKQLSLSLFEDPPDCNPQVALRNPVRKDRGFESQIIAKGKRERERIV